MSFGMTGNARARPDLADTQLHIVRIRRHEANALRTPRPDDFRKERNDQRNCLGSTPLVIEAARQFRECVIAIFLAWRGIRWAQGSKQPSEAALAAPVDRARRRLRSMSRAGAATPVARGAPSRRN